MMKKLTLSLALLSVALLAYPSSAQDPERKRADGQKGPAGERPERGQGRGGPGADRDPAQMVARMMQEFDKDGDQKLDTKELTALLVSMRDRRGAAGQGQAGQGRPGQGQARQGRPGQGRPGQEKPGAEGQRRRGGAEEAGKPGGQRPERPSDDA